MWTTVILATALVFWGVAGEAGAGERHGRKPKPPPLEFSDARILIEFNATAQDVGIQVNLDGEGWRSVKGVDPRGKRIFDIEARSGVRKTGITELFFESAEPSLEDLPLDEFLARFPEGEYEFSGVTVEGERIEGEALLTHAIPDGPVLLSPAEGSVVDPDHTIVAWGAVADPPGSSIFEYQVIVERADIRRNFSVFVPASVTSVTVPSAFMQAGSPYKFEVLAIEQGGNQSLSESFFSTGN